MKKITQIVLTLFFNCWFYNESLRKWTHFGWFWWIPLRFSSNSRKFPNLLITLNISNFFVFKYFLDRKKVLKAYRLIRSFLRKTMSSGQASGTIGTQTWRRYDQKSRYCHLHHPTIRRVYDLVDSRCPPPPAVNACDFPHEILFFLQDGFSGVVVDNREL